MVECLTSLHEALSWNLSATGGKKEGRERWEEGGGGEPRKQGKKNQVPLPLLFALKPYPPAPQETSVCFVLFCRVVSYMSEAGW